jgi:hypothetical protein
VAAKKRQHLMMERIMMNRRQLLQTLSVLTAGGAWTVVTRPLNAISIAVSGRPSEESLISALTESKSMCAAILVQSDVRFESNRTRTADRLNELALLTDQAMSRAMKQSHSGPAFWQACGDAFLRTADLLSACARQRPTAAMQQAEAAFRRTAQLLAAETLRSTRQQAG